jgi:hypothetical protein
MSETFMPEPEFPQTVAIEQGDEVTFTLEDRAQYLCYTCERPAVESVRYLGKSLNPTLKTAGGVEAGLCWPCMTRRMQAEAGLQTAVLDFLHELERQSPGAVASEIPELGLPAR